MPDFQGSLSDFKASMDESDKPLNDTGNRWFKTNDTPSTWSLIPMPRGNRMTKEERQRKPYLSDNAWKAFKSTKRKER